MLKNGNKILEFKPEIMKKVLTNKRKYFLNENLELTFEVCY